MHSFSIRPSDFFISRSGLTDSECGCVCVREGWGWEGGIGAVVEELGQAPAAEVGEDEECRPRLAASLVLNPNWQIKQRFRGPWVCLGQPGEGAAVLLTCRSQERPGQVR